MNILLSSENKWLLCWNNNQPKDNNNQLKSSEIKNMIEKRMQNDKII